MRHFDMSRIDRRVQGAPASRWLPRANRWSGAFTVGTGLLVGAGIGAYLAFGPFRAVAARAAERARDAGGELIQTARGVGDRRQADHAFVDLPTAPEPALASGHRDPGGDLAARP